MKRTLAQRYWSDFERLAFELTTDCFGITPTKVLRTQDSKDGGFDAVIIHELGKLREIMISHETLMEAKFRTRKDAVGLRAFAATMIIAFNGQARCLVVVSNREFSPQAFEAARSFQWKSRLDVILVNQKTLSAWIRPRYEELVRRYPKEMLRDVVLPNPEDEKYQEIEIRGNGAEPAARIASGRLPAGKVPKLEIVIPQTETVALSRAVIGKARRNLVSDINRVLAKQCGSAVLQGEPGIGKSHVVLAALRDLPIDRRCIGIVDASQITTSRQIFLSIVAQLSGVEIADAARQFTFHDAKEVFSTVGGAKIPEEILAAVLAVLSSSSVETNDVDHIHLAEYISFIADTNPTEGRILVFSNLDKTSGEVLEFLHSLIPKLTQSSISTLIELSLGSGTQLLGASKWTAYVDLFSRSATLGIFSVPSLDLEDAVEMLLEYLPGLGPERAKFITERVGNKPLFLHHAALWLKQQNVVAERARNVHLIEKPEIYFEGIRPHTSIAVLDRHIDIWRRETNLPFADMITAATLLNGSLSVAAVQLLVPAGLDVVAVLDALIETGLFVSEPGLGGVRVSHALLLERMTAIEKGEVPGYGERKFSRKRVAENLLEGIADYTDQGAIRDFHRSSLLITCERWSEAWQSAKSAGDNFIKENQLAIAAKAFFRCIHAAEHLISEDDSSGNLWRIYALIDYLQVENQRYRIGLEENRTLLETLAVSLSTTGFSVECSDGQDLFLRARYLRWRAAFTREDFDEALITARELFDQVCKLENVDSEVAGRAVSSLGVTLKALEQTDESKLIFQKGVSRFPTSIYCQEAEWSNLAAFALRARPGRSIVYYNRILVELSDRLPLLERIHVEVDLAMAMFLAGYDNKSFTQAVKAVRMADANGIPAQAARGRNIIGCLRWGEGQLGEAISFLDRAILDAERSYMERFLWRFRVNLASASSEAGEIDRALANARWAEERLVNSRSHHWLQIAASSQHITSRWYVALLVIGQVYYKCNSLDDKERLGDSLEQLPHFRQHLRALIRGEYPAEVFQNTTHLRKNCITITG